MTFKYLFKFAGETLHLYISPHLVPTLSVVCAVVLLVCLTDKKENWLSRKRWFYHWTGYYFTKALVNTKPKLMHMIQNSCVPLDFESKT